MATVAADGGGNGGGGSGAGGGAGASVSSSTAVTASSTATATSSSSSSKPKAFVIVYNVQKNHNIGNLVRSCVAFGVEEVVVVGKRKVSKFGSQGTIKHMHFTHVETFADAIKYVRSLGCTVCGIEIVPQAKPIQSHPFTGNTAFILGNEGAGMNAKAIAACDQFVYIPQFGNGTASLNVTVAGSIILHHFASWAGYKECERDKSAEAKFMVQPVTSTRRDTEAARRIAAERAKRRRVAQEESPAETTATTTATPPAAPTATEATT